MQRGERLTEPFLLLEQCVLLPPLPGLCREQLFLGNWLRGVSVECIQLPVLLKLSHSSG